MVIPNNAEDMLLKVFGRLRKRSFSLGYLFSWRWGEEQPKLLKTNEQSEFVRSYEELQRRELELLGDSIPLSEMVEWLQGFWSSFHLSKGLKLKLL